MCGIAGIVSLSSKSQEIDQQSISKLSKKLYSRGPDAYGYWRDNNAHIHLLNRRLATQDKRIIANQPCYSQDRRIVCVLNGEIYNHGNLRSELKIKGYKFQTKNDAEVLANGYDYWGAKILDKIQGQFSFIIYNIKTHTGLISRDERGICPLYYTIHKYNLIVSSTVQSILEIKNLKKEIDTQSVYDFFVSQSSNYGRSFVKGINFLLPGTSIKFKLNEGFKKESFKNTKKSDFSIFSNKSERKIISEIKNLFKNSVDECLQGDKKVGIYLSGGIDSASILSYLRAIKPKEEINTFTASFIETESNENIGEQDQAKYYSKLFRSTHHNVKIKQEHIVNDLGKFDLPQEGIIDSAITRLAILSKKKKVEVALSGEGADEMFLGYDHFLAAIGLLNHDFKWLTKTYKIRDNYALKKFNSNKNLLNIFNGGGSSVFLDQNNHLFLSKKNKNIVSIKKQLSGIIREIENENIVSDISQKLVYIDYFQKVPNNLLRRAERNSMGNGVEMRFPYLNSNLISYLYKVPLKYKIGNGSLTKILLRKTLKDLLPDDILDRPKSPFALPVARTKHHEKSSLIFKKPAFSKIFYNNFDRVYNSVTNGKFNDLGIFKKKYLEKILNKQKNIQTCFYDPILWRLWSMSEWYEKNL